MIKVASILGLSGFLMITVAGCGPSGGTTELPKDTGTENIDPYMDAPNPDA
jgi:hypothetical protein